jgi:hypothetical protein
VTRGTARMSPRTRSRKRGSRTPSSVPDSSSSPARTHPAAGHGATTGAADARLRRRWRGDDPACGDNVIRRPRRVLRSQARAGRASRSTTSTAMSSRTQRRGSRTDARRTTCREPLSARITERKQAEERDRPRDELHPRNSRPSAAWRAAWRDLAHAHCDWRARWLLVSGLDPTASAHAEVDRSAVLRQASVLRSSSSRSAALSGAEASTSTTPSPRPRPIRPCSGTASSSDGLRGARAAAVVADSGADRAGVAAWPRTRATPRLRAVDDRDPKRRSRRERRARARRGAGATSPSPSPTRQEG